MTKAAEDDERKALLSSLNSQRQHVLGILEGLPEELLRRPVLPSGWTCVGFVHHLALDVERFWFRTVVAGRTGPTQAPGAGPEAGGAQNAWHVPLGVPGNTVLDLYRHEIELANAIIGATPLDRAPAWWPERWPDWRFPTYGPPSFM